MSVLLSVMPLTTLTLLASESYTTRFWRAGSAKLDLINAALLNGRIGNSMLSVYG